MFQEGGKNCQHNDLLAHLAKGHESLCHGAASVVNFFL